MDSGNAIGDDEMLVGTTNIQYNEIILFLHEMYQHVLLEKQPDT